MKLSDHHALTFDCYGTLIDWESGVIAGLQPLTDKVDRDLARDEILEAHARHEASQQLQTPATRYRDILSIVYRRLAEEWGVGFTHQEALNYGRSVKSWPESPDTTEALNYLKKHFKLVILFDVDNESFSGSNARLGVQFDAIYTAEDCGSYKPSDRNIDYMLDKLKTIRIQRSDILHTAESLFHVHAPANRHGLANCWIYRRYDDKQGFGATIHPGDMPEYNFRFNSLMDMARAHQAELGA